MLFQSVTQVARKSKSEYSQQEIDEPMTFWLLVPMLYQLSYKRLVGTKHAAYS